MNRVTSDDIVGIWQAFIADDRKAFEVLYRRFYSDLFHYALKLTQNKALSEDIIHEVFCYLWQKRKQLKGVHSIKFYLIRAVRNQVLKDLKGQSGVETFDQTVHDTQAIFIPEEINILETQQGLKAKVAKALNSLSSRQREIIYLKYYSNLDYEEISELLSMNYQSVINLAYRAIQKLRKQNIEWI